jgi:hypothetical protein
MFPKSSPDRLRLPLGSCKALIFSSMEASISTASTKNYTRCDIATRKRV